MSHPIQEEDRIATGKIVLTAVISLSIFGVGALWSISIQRGEMKTIVSQPGPLGPAAAGAPEVGIVYQWPFSTSQFANEKAAETKGRLERYGWVDKNAKVVHIPIEEAMQKYVQQAGGGK
jgi:hypothetical protein